MTENSSRQSAVDNFSALGLPDSLCNTLAELGYEQPSAIQQKAIGPFLEGRDILGMAQTGTGKTAAFALPLLTRIDINKKQPQALILAPTRELAIQVSEAFQSYAKHQRGFHVMPIYGGQDMGSQLRKLKRGVHVVVGTPGRVMDHMRRNSLDLSGLQTLVLDEADEMLRMGFIDDVEWVLQRIPEKRQMALFSATMPQQIARITGEYLNDPVEIRIASQTKTVESVEQTYMVVQNNRKMDALTRVLEVEEFDAVIVFVRTKTATMELAQKLEARGFSSAAINGDLNQKQREITLSNLKRGTIDILVATDVAARGIDVARISLVVNFDIPYDAEAYVHRIGRTGRAGREGKALLMVTPREKRLLKMIERSTRQPIEHRPVPSNEEIGAQRWSRFRERLLSVLESESLDNLRELVGELQSETGEPLENIAAGLAFLAQESRPLSLTEEFESEGRSQRGGREERRERQGFNEDRASSKDKSQNPPRERPSKKSRSEREASRASIDMDIYRLEVGINQGVAVKDILGAVANELELDSDYIGEIRLDQDCSYIELPEGMPKDLRSEFRKVRIRGHQSNASLVKDSVDMSVRTERGPDRGPAENRFASRKEGDEGDEGRGANARKPTKPRKTKGKSDKRPAVSKRKARTKDS